MNPYESSKLKEFRDKRIYNLPVILLCLGMFSVGLWLGIVVGYEWAVKDYYSVPIRIIE